MKSVKSIKTILGVTAMLMMTTGIRLDTGFAQEAKPDFEVEDNRLKLPTPIEFETGSATLKAESSTSLEHIKAYLESKSYITTMRIEGHVCCGASDVDAQKLSEQRALAVTAWLISKGIDCKRLLPVGFGPTKPVADGTTPQGRAENNRIEVRNAALKDRAIGGMPTDGGGKVAGDPCSAR